MSATDSLRDVYVYYEEQRVAVINIALRLQIAGNRSLADELRKAVKWRACDYPDCVLELHHTGQHFVGQGTTRQ